MCKTITTHYVGCSPAEGPTHTTATTVECAAAKTYRSKGFWFDCNPRPLTVWRDDTCTVCGNTPAKKLARVLKNPVHMLRFFGEKGVHIQCCEEAIWGQGSEEGERRAGCGDGWAIGKGRVLSFWEMMQHVKVEIALEAKGGAMGGRETPGEIIGRILA
ncbi:hypothetical protein DV737_g4235, partial [Chaetothyriales sp. CBS 132003]